MRKGRVTKPCTWGPDSSRPLLCTRHPSEPFLATTAWCHPHLTVEETEAHEAMQLLRRGARLGAHTVWPRVCRLPPAPAQVTAMVKMLKFLFEAQSRHKDTLFTLCRHSVCSLVFSGGTTWKQNGSGDETGDFSIFQVSTVHRYCSGDRNYFFLAGTSYLHCHWSPSAFEHDCVRLPPVDSGSQEGAVTVGRRPPQ